MSESVKTRIAASLPPGKSTEDLFLMFTAMQADVEQLRSLLATHIHSGVTAGAGNTGVPTVTIASTALNAQP